MVAAEIPTVAWSGSRHSWRLVVGTNNSTSAAIPQPSTLNPQPSTTALCNLFASGTFTSRAHREQDPEATHAWQERQRTRRARPLGGGTMTADRLESNVAFGGPEAARDGP